MGKSFLGTGKPRGDRTHGGQETWSVSCCVRRGLGCQVAQKLGVLGAYFQLDTWVLGVNSF